MGAGVASGLGARSVVGVTTDLQTCYRHGDRRAGVRCQRCERPICPDCMNQASVGFHCPECVRSSAQTVYTARTLRAGGPGGTTVTSALVAINVAIYVATSLGSGLMSPSFAFQLDWALIGRGFSRAEGIIGVAEGEWWRLVTGGFLHGSLLHLGFNMYILWMLGKQFEPRIGSGRFAAVYGSSLLAGSLGVMLLDPGALTVGASGAVFGLFGFAVVSQLGQGINPMQTGLGGIVLINLLFTFLVPGISIGGHVGGLLGGVVVGVLYEVTARRMRLPAAATMTAIGTFGLLCAVVSVAVAGA